MSATVEMVRVLVVHDMDADTSYLEQDERADRLAQFNDGQFGFVGVMLEAEVKIPYGSDFITERITTPGLWSIEDDSGEDYYLSVGEDEYHTLSGMLNELHIPTPVRMSGEIIYR